MKLPSGDMLVVGLGVSGDAAAHFLLDHAAKEGGRVVVVDSEDTPGLREAAERVAAQGAEVMLGISEVQGEYDLAVVSPGIPPSSPLRLSAQAHSHESIGELELAYRVSISPWIAVTGTNGKTTVTSLIAHLLSSVSIPAIVAGNIGPAATQIATASGNSTTIVAEVSSFQLAATHYFHPRVSVLLNITPDHLDWHGSMEAYTSDKTAIFRNQGSGDTAVIDIDDVGSASLVEFVLEMGVDVRRVSTQMVPELGAGMREGVLILATGSGEIELVHRDELVIKGDHNVSNALAASAAAYAVGVGGNHIAAGLRSFEPIAHRLEPLMAVDGVEYVNDSKATNPDATIKALTAFRDRPLIVLLGGRNKGNSFDDLAICVASACKGAVVFGEAADTILEALKRAGFEAVHTEDLEEAVGVAAQMAAEGDVVLLSPACASFDQFHNYVDRGESFRRHVETMAGEGM